MGLSGGIQIHLSSQMWGIYSSEGEGGGLWLLDISYWCHFISSMSLTIITNCSPLPTSNVPLLRKFYKEHSGLTWILLWQLCKISLIISSVPHIKLLYTRICVPYKIWAETVGVLWYLPPIVGWLRGGGLSHWAFEFLATLGIRILATLGIWILATLGIRILATLGIRIELRLSIPPPYFLEIQRWMSPLLF